MEAQTDIIIIDDGESQEEDKVSENSTISSKNSASSSISLARTSTAPLKKCFRAIVSGQKVVLDLDTLEFIIQKEIKISTCQLDSRLQQILPYMLVSYIKSWPGWSRSEDYRNGSLQFDEYFEKFYKYANFKLTYLIQKGYQKAIIELKNDSPQKEINPCFQTCIETQCESGDFKGSKPFSAFNVNIEGPPRLLNTLIFAAQEDDVLLKMHTIKDWYADFNIQQLINWPFLEIEFSSPFIIFTRKMVPDYRRYLARTDDILMSRKPEFIENVRVDPDVCRTTYSRDFVKKYLEGYMKHLKSKNLDPNIISEISIIFSEFYRDIEEVGRACQNGICDSTTICFNIGGCRYVRNKKTAGVGSSKNPNAPSVGFCEVITPKCSIQLTKNIHMEQASNSNISTILLTPFFDSTQKLLENQNKHLYNILPSIMYCCNYCKKQYGGTYALSAVLKHYQEDHRMEHAIMCSECKKQYNVTDLSKSRWYHSCEFNPTAKNPIPVNLFPSEGWKAWK